MAEQKLSERQQDLLPEIDWTFNLDEVEELFTDHEYTYGAGTPVTVNDLRRVLNRLRKAALDFEGGGVVSSGRLAVESVVDEEFLDIRYFLEIGHEYLHTGNPSQGQLHYLYEGDPR